jgi:RNA polymerase sigma factor (sigma-70 family)
MSGTDVRLAEHRRPDEQFAAEWRRIEPPLLRRAQRRPEAREAGADEEDLMQEVAILLWSRYAQTKVENPFGLAAKIAHDLRVSRLRRRSATFVELSLECEPGVDPGVDELLDRQRSDREVDELMWEYLAPDERAAMRLRLADLSSPEAAASLGVSADRCRDLWKEARRKLAHPLATLRVHGRCRMVVGRLDAYARGELASDDAAHAVVVRHLAGCPSCRRWVRARRASAPRV